jgi:valyl-tRNA synthetase
MQKKDIPKAYEALNHEDTIYSAWEESGFFNPDNLSGEPFCIMMPPPNVTGVLHLGHALENTIMDSMIRYQRMHGRKTLLVPGTDHAAVATQARVEKNLVEKGIENPREYYGREKLLEHIREYVEESKTTILSQIKKMGTSADWSRLAYTFDDERSQAVNTVFEKMFNDGLIYRGYRVVNWSVKGQSTCSDDELVYVDRKAMLYTFKYAEHFPFTIATTRPETKLGDTAVAVHPDDDRYKEYIGQTLEVNFCGNDLKLKVIADEGVDPAFGTGALGVTPAHSPIDFEMYEKQKAQGNDIGLIQVIGEDGRMTPHGGADFVNLSVEEAREKVVEQLKEKGLLVREEEIEQNVGTSDRFGDVVEAIPMTQWFVAVNKEIPGRGKTLKQLMKEAVEVGHKGDPNQKVAITPTRFEAQYYNWIDNLRDWCISRQVWWGHRIPVWYHNTCQTIDESGQSMYNKPAFVGEIYRNENSNFICPNCGLGYENIEHFSQDPDTLDTWFSSGLWTFSTLGWPNKKEDLKTFHPTSWMQMGYEILFFWMARMILMSTYTLDEIPFKDVYIHGMLRDKDGQKFSKSLGNGIDPIEVIEKYSADALRFSLITGVTPGNDSRFYEEKVEAAQRLVNKLWNISRFILLSVDEVHHSVAFSELNPTTTADKWILSELTRLEEEVSTHMQKAEFSQATEKLREFTWGEFADWYLEIAKTQQQTETLKVSTDAILIYVLEHLLTYWHPIMPFITEAIWKQIDPKDLLMAHTWPVMRQIDLDLEAEMRMDQLKEIVGAVRAIRAEYNVEPKKEISVVIVGSSLESEKEVMIPLMRAMTCEFTEEFPEGDYASVVVGHAQVFVSLEGLVDRQKEQIRLEKDRNELMSYVESLTEKLSNEAFTSKAPTNVVDEMRGKYQDAQERLEAIKQQLINLSL